jgi:hypothetical protein
MNIFGWTITRRVAPERRRAERNAAAMISAVGLAALPAELASAARIHRDEISLAEHIVRTADATQWRRKAHGQPVYAFHPDEFASALRKRLGAAAAVEVDPQFAPILAEEIAILEHAVADIDADIFVSRRLAADGRALLEDLHVRFGHAEAVQYLGTVVVFARNTLPAASAAALPGTPAGPMPIPAADRPGG